MSPSDAREMIGKDHPAEPDAPLQAAQDQLF